MNSQTLHAEKPALFTTVGDREVDLLHPDAASIHLADIAHHLAGTPRFGGALADRNGAPLLYMVAEHSLHVAQCVVGYLEHTDWPFWAKREALLGALLHDAAEAYCGDATSPLKAAMLDVMRRRRGGFCPIASEYGEIESAVAAAIDRRFGLGIIPPYMGETLTREHIARCIKDADTAVYVAEAVQLRGWGLDRFTQHGGGAALYANRCLQYRLTTTKVVQYFLPSRPCAAMGDACLTEGGLFAAHSGCWGLL